MNTHSRAAPDKLLLEIAEYASGEEVANASAYECARYCLMDAVGKRLKSKWNSSSVMRAGAVKARLRW